MRNHPWESTTAKGPGMMRPSKKLKLDACLESAHALIEAQPVAIHITLSDTAITMLLLTRKLREKRAGLVNLMSNPNIFLCSTNIQIKLDFPEELEEDKKTMENVQE
jgi:hypothetical protein